eukprot:gene377-475_t
MINCASLNIEGLPTSNGIDNDLDSIDYSDLNFFDTKEIGRGSFGQVQKASYFGTDVAVKSLSSLVSIDPDHYKFMLREIKILKSMRHPNIVQYIGASTHEGKHMIVTEFISGGDLHQFIKEKGVNSIPWMTKLKLSLDIASAFSYLHSKKVIFRDLKAKNILVEEMGNTLRAKVIDFGFARILDISQDKNAKLQGYLTICGSETTMAPEVMVGTNYDDSCDVYSFGVLLLELICGPRVVKTQLKRSPISAFDMNLDKAEYLSPSNCPRAFLDLAKWCLEYNSKKRPDFKTIVKGLSQLIQTPIEILPIKGESKPYVDPNEDNDDCVDMLNEHNRNDSFVLYQSKINSDNNSPNGNHPAAATDENEEYASVIYNSGVTNPPLNIDYGGRQQEKRHTILSPSFFNRPSSSSENSSNNSSSSSKDESDVPSTLYTSLTVDDIKYLTPVDPIPDSFYNMALLSGAQSSPNLTTNPAETSVDPPQPSIKHNKSLSTSLGGQQNNKPKKSKGKSKKKKSQKKKS